MRNIIIMSCCLGLSGCLTAGLALGVPAGYMVGKEVKKTDERKRDMTAERARNVEEAKRRMIAEQEARIGVVTGHMYRGPETAPGDTKALEEEYIENQETMYRMPKQASRTPQPSLNQQPQQLPQYQLLPYAQQQYRQPTHAVPFQPGIPPREMTSQQEKMRMEEIPARRQIVPAQPQSFPVKPDNQPDNQINQNGEQLPWRKEIKEKTTSSYVKDKETEVLATPLFAGEKKPAPDEPVFSYVNEDVIRAELYRRYISGEITKVIAVKVKSQNGVVTLEGSVPSLKVAERAKEIAGKTKGVKYVVSNLQVLEVNLIPSSGQGKATDTATDLSAAISPVKGAADLFPGSGKYGDVLNADEKIEAEINEKFTSGDLTRVIAIHAEINNGNITLYGRVPAQVVADRAVSVAKKISGVKSVDSKLSVVEMVIVTPEESGKTGN